jgi:hypothetical protein
MKTEAYTAPQSQLIEDDQNNVPFYVVSKRKFFLLYFFTMGYFVFYWHYQNWYRFRSVNNVRLNPPVRAIFYMFFVHRLFAEVEKANQMHEKIKWWPGLSASLIILLLLGSAACDLLSRQEVGYPFTALFELVVSFPLLAFIYAKAQLVMNAACGDPSGESNSDLTGLNYFWIALGVFVWIAGGAAIYLAYTGKL